MVVQNHWGFADESEHPGLTECVTLTSAQAERGVVEPSGEAINNHRVALAVDDVLDLTDHTREPGG